MSKDNSTLNVTVRRGPRPTAIITRQGMITTEASDLRRRRIAEAIRALCESKVPDRLDGPLRQIISDLTESKIDGAMKERLEIIAAACGDASVKKALELWK